MSDHLSDIVFQEVIAERDALRQELAEWKSTNRVICGEREAAEADVTRLRGEIEDYILWAPGRAGHAAAHARLRAALAEDTP